MRSLKREKQKKKNILQERIKEVEHNFQHAQNLVQQRQYDKAKLLLLKVVKIAPQHFVAQHLLGCIYLENGLYQKALEALKCSIQHCPAYYPALESFAQYGALSRQFDKAIEILYVAQKQYPEMPSLDYALGDIFFNKGDLVKSESHFVSTIEKCAQKNSALALRASAAQKMIPFETPRIFETKAQEEADEKAFIQQCERAFQSDDPLQVDVAPLDLKRYYYTAYSSQNGKKVLETLGELYRHQFPELVYESPSLNFSRPSSKIKVGIFSAHLDKRHAVHFCFGEIIRGLDRDQFELISFVPSTYISDFPKSEQIANMRIVYIPTNLSEIRAVIEREGLDILWYLDIGITLHAYRLAHSRLAPVQVVSLGHPSTTGLPTVDYMISSAEIEPQNGQEFYTETLVPLKGLPSYYEEPQKISDVGRAHFGLPEDKHIYLCPQPPFKLQYVMDDYFYDILEQDPEGILVIIRLGFDDKIKARWEKNKLKKFEARIIYMKEQTFPDYLALMKCADVLLDTTPFGGGNTCFQPCALGVPMAAIEGEQGKGRIAAAFYRRMGLEDLIAKNRAEYVKNALKLGTDKAYRSKISQHILENKHKIFEDQKIVAAHNEFLCKIGQESRMKAAS